AASIAVATTIDDKCRLDVWNYLYDKAVERGNMTGPEDCVQQELKFDMIIPNKFFGGFILSEFLKRIFKMINQQKPIRMMFFETKSLGNYPPLFWTAEILAKNEIFPIDTWDVWKS
ncbi:hypothetical protein ACJX0J_016386, partial [Zea mays]